MVTVSTVDHQSRSSAPLAARYIVVPETEIDIGEGDDPLSWFQSD